LDGWGASLRRRYDAETISYENRLKPKAGEISKDVAYFSGADIEDLWVDYPWSVLHDPAKLLRNAILIEPIYQLCREMTDILTHDDLKKQDDALAAKKA
jgi:hypothetical protein